MKMKADVLGNIIRSANKEDRRSSLEPIVKREVKSRRFSTGIGGCGNFAYNDVRRPEDMRAALDMYSPGIVLDKGKSYFGIGMRISRLSV